LIHNLFLMSTFTGTITERNKTRELSSVVYEQVRLKNWGFG